MISTVALFVATVFLLTTSFVANAGPYNDIPKALAKDDKKAKSLKIGYNITNNLTQKQSLFFVEGILKNDSIDHTSRFDIASASTSTDTTTTASTGSTLFRTTTLKELHKFYTNPKEPLILTAVGYGRLYDFHDNITPQNNLKDQIITTGFGLSNSKIYTAGFSVGVRNADVFFVNDKHNIRSYIVRPSFVYNNTVKNIIPPALKSFLSDYQIFDFATETNLKIEYALIASYNTNIQQVYVGFEKSLSKNISLAIFYDLETTLSSYQTLESSNKIEKISTSLVLKL